MCEFLSAIVTQTGDVLWSKSTDHHEHLVDHFELNDSQREPMRWVRVEFKPGQNPADASGYNLTLDEREAPDWWEGRKEKAERTLRGIVEQMIITGDKKILLGGTWILAGKANVGQVVNARIVYMLDSSKIGYMGGSSNIGEMRESSNVGAMRESSNVGVMRESSNVGDMWGSSKIGVMRGSSKIAVMRESSNVGYMWGSSKVGEMQGSSKIATDNR